MPRQTARMAAAVQSTECIGQGDNLAVLELKPVVGCTLTWPTWIGKSLPCSLAGISHCFKVKQTAHLLWVSCALGEHRGTGNCKWSTETWSLGEALNIMLSLVLLKLWSVLPQRLTCCKGLLLTEASREICSSISGKTLAVGHQKTNWNPNLSLPCCDLKSTLAFLTPFFCTCSPPTTSPVFCPPD